MGKDKDWSESFSKNQEKALKKSQEEEAIRYQRFENGDYHKEQEALRQQHSYDTGATKEPGKKWESAGQIRDAWEESLAKKQKK